MLTRMKIVLSSGAFQFSNWVMRKQLFGGAAGEESAIAADVPPTKAISARGIRDFIANTPSDVAASTKRIINQSAPFPNGFPARRAANALGFEDDPAAPDPSYARRVCVACTGAGA